jgi:hypothetical protein
VSGDALGRDSYGKGVRVTGMGTWRQELGEGKVALVFFMPPKQRVLVERLTGLVAFLTHSIKRIGYRTTSRGVVVSFDSF